MTETIMETPRLVLRCLGLDDVQEVANLYADPVGMATKGGPRPYGYAEHTVKEALSDYAVCGYGFWATIYKANGRLIGLCGLLNQDIDGRQEVEVAYMLAREYWGQGLATEAAQAITEFGFSRLGRTRLVSLISPQNMASQRVALKNGMVQEREIVDSKGQVTRLYVRERPVDARQPRT